MAFALRALGKDVRIVNHDPAPPQFFVFPGSARSKSPRSVDGSLDASS
jgi:hypothetical protein